MKWMQKCDRVHVPECLPTWVEHAQVFRRDDGWAWFAICEVDDFESGSFRTLRAAIADCEFFLEQPGEPVLVTYQGKGLHHWAFSFLRGRPQR